MEGVGKWSAVITPDPLNGPAEAEKVRLARFRVHAVELFFGGGPYEHTLLGSLESGLGRLHPRSFTTSTNKWRHDLYLPYCSLSYVMWVDLIATLAVTAASFLQ